MIRKQTTNAPDRGGDGRRRRSPEHMGRTEKLLVDHSHGLDLRHPWLTGLAL